MQILKKNRQIILLDDLPGGGTPPNNEKIANTEVQHPENSKNRGEFWQKTLLDDVPGGGRGEIMKKIPNRGATP